MTYVESPSIKSGVETIKTALENMPESSGVYKMCDASGVILYIGKAKNLKNRVSSYTNINLVSNRIKHMISLARSVDFITTENEAEALLLEAILIKKEMPRYNILLKDNKSFPYILFSQHSFPQISKYRGNKQQQGSYFGPFVSVTAVHEMIALLQKSFLLRSCSDNIFKNRNRPCLQYQIKRCSAPCVGFIDKEQYAKLTKEAALFLNGKVNEVREDIARQMEEASDGFDYERAAIFRDRLKAITAIQRQQSGNVEVENADLFSLYRESENCAVYVGCYRHGNFLGSEYFFPNNTSDSSDFEIISLTIMNYYLRRAAPKTIYVNCGSSEELISLQSAISIYAREKIYIEKPLKGNKFDILKRASLSAKEALARKNTQDGFSSQTWSKLSELLGFTADMQRVEIYDNSHISGTNAIGAMVVATPEGFEKTSYRVFNIKGEIVAGDDYAMMREMLLRRFKALATNDAEDAAKSPDLVIIDGGKGQLGVALKVFEELDIQNIKLIAISKGENRNAGRESIHIPQVDPFQLEHADQRLHLLQRMRDEAHRFAIGTHRKKRNKEFTKSGLNEIPNVGPKRKRALLNYFGSMADVASASVNELRKVEGISAALAEQIHEYFFANKNN